MIKSNLFKPIAVGKRKRYSYAKSQEIVEMPHLLELQRASYEWFYHKGLREILADISPIQDSAHKWALYFDDYYFGECKYDIEQCKVKNTNYSAPLYVKVRLENKMTGELNEQDIFLCDYPLMTNTGTFIINGRECVVISQLMRAPGLYCKKEKDSTNRDTYTAKIIPEQGKHLEFIISGNGGVYVSIGYAKKIPVTVLLRAFGYSTDEELLSLFNYDFHIQKSLELEDYSMKTQMGSWITLAKIFYPREPATSESGENAWHNHFRNIRNYDLGRAGRYKLNQTLSWIKRIYGCKISSPIYNKKHKILLKSYSFINKEAIDKLNEGDVFSVDGLVKIDVEQKNGTPFCMLCTNAKENGNSRFLEISDVIATINYLLSMTYGFVQPDDMCHLENRQVRRVGNFLSWRFRKGLESVERVIRERMTNQDQDKLTPQALINIRPLVGIIRNFFYDSPFVYYEDQTNPLASLMQKRLLTSLGTDGLNRFTAGYEIRDVHYSHYGRISPVETSDRDVGLFSTLANYGVVNKYGLIETPYRLVDSKTHTITNRYKYLMPGEEEDINIAQSSTPINEKGCFLYKNIPSRHGAKILNANPKEIELIDVSAKQILGIATSLIPFIEHDDVYRANISAKEQQNALSLIHPEAPLVGTGMEWIAAHDSGVCTYARRSGKVYKITGRQIIVKAADGDLDTYNLVKFMETRQNTCINQRIIVRKGDVVNSGDILADGMATDNGELALGQNVRVALVSWEGYNYNDAIIISERLVKEDLYTSIHIRKYECTARDTKLGEEEIRRDVPSASEKDIEHLGKNGIIKVGVDVRPGDILVAKVTPKGETELSSEERLLRAIFGDKEREVNDTSIRVPHGEYGKVIAVNFFDRKNDDELEPGVNQLVQVYVATKRKIEVGDKLADRHGNKGVCSKVVREEDMPYTRDGRPIDILLNPLTITSRMNIGQLLEISLSWACHQLGKDIQAALQAGVESEKYKIMKKRLIDVGYDFDVYGMPMPEKSGLQVASPAFDGCQEKELLATLKAAGIPINAKAELYDGRTGEKLEGPVSIGWEYMIKTNSCVQDEMHARSTGPYSLVTLQPRYDESVYCGYRVGEMEVWALEAYGVAYILEEILTCKSDAVMGAINTHNIHVKGESMPISGVPNSFKVLVKELQSLGFEIQIFNANGEKFFLDEDDDIPQLPNEDFSLEFENNTSWPLKNSFGQEDELLENGFIYESSDPSSIM